jgi:hypothetical protein
VPERTGLMRRRNANGATRWRWLLGLGVAAAAVSTALTATPAVAIVGGTISNWSDYPYFAKLTVPGGPCGGTVIAPTLVLTAAHCVSGLTPGQVTVGLHNTGAPWQPTGFVVHPLWNGDATDGHDLALVEVPAAATAGITPIQVGTPFDPGAYAGNTEATIVGRGRHIASSPPDLQLRAADTPIRSDDFMDDIYNPLFGFDHWIEALMIGAGSTGQTTCFGDSGGPLVVWRNGRPVQVGITSFARGTGCNVPAGFAELNNQQLAWVASHVPSIVPTWSPCTPANTTNPGRPRSFYGMHSTGLTDGPYRWSIWCEAIPPPATVVVPWVIGMLCQDARATLQSAGLSGFCHTGRWVVDQNPSAGEVVPRGWSVALTTSSDPPHEG